MSEQRRKFKSSGQPIEVRRKQSASKIKPAIERLHSGLVAHLLQAISAQAYGRAISSSGFRLLEKLRDCATSDIA